MLFLATHQIIRARMLVRLDDLALKDLRIEKMRVRLAGFFAETWMARKDESRELLPDFFHATKLGRQRQGVVP